jgi:hypothetical protein
MADHPGWPFKIPEATARWLNEHSVVAIKYDWKMTDVDKSEDWLVLVGSDNEELIVSTGFFSIYPEVSFSPRSQGLIDFKSWIDVPGQLQKIDAWRKKEQHDLSEYKRLKEKFGDTI